MTRFPRALPVAIFVLVMAVTLLACYGIGRVEQRSQLTQLRERASAISSALERRANASSTSTPTSMPTFTPVNEALV